MAEGNQENNKDYVSLGLKVGLEIHQQLDTRKLFSPMPSIVNDISENKSPDKIIIRELSAVEGELGRVDKAALAEQKKKKKFYYHYFNDSCSLIEADEEPPINISKEALDIVLQVSKILNADIVDVIQVMRKIVIDGSNTSGFQRTALVALNGKLDNIGIETICIEEDSAKIVERQQDKDIYDLSRLGVPLIEIATAPDIRTPEEAKDIAKKIGMILRSTGKVKRGLGTIRQDLNVSIKKGVRVEIKGVQDLNLIPTLVKYEIERQESMIKIYEELSSKGISFDNNIYDLTRLLSKTKSNVLRNALDNKGVVLAIKLPKHKGYLGREIQPGRRYGTELSDYAKTQGVKGLFHSDELPKYGITQEEVNMIREELKLSNEDAFIMIAEEYDKSYRAINTVLKKASKLYLEKEVRNANQDGTTSYLRPMPGSSRMYPETDIELIFPDKENIIIPELIDEKIKRFQKQYSLNQDQATKMAKSKYDLDELVKKYPNIEPSFIVVSLLDFPKEIKKRENIEVDPSILLESVFDKLNNSLIIQDSVKEILIEFGKTGKINYDNYRKLSEKEIDNIINKIIQENEGAPFGALMGKAMSKLRGKVEGKIISSKIKWLLEKQK
jgi:glutamyl-tRNA(Gln) amidotransferase subunit E